MCKLTILSGLPGAGKSDITQKIAAQSIRQRESIIKPLIVSADSYPGLYEGGLFHPELLSLAHRACFKQAALAVSQGRSVIVDNTSLTPIEIAPYVALGRAFDYEVEIVRIHCDPTVAFKRQTHGVPVDVFAAMVDRFHAFIAPPFWEAKIIEVG